MDLKTQYRGTAVMLVSLPTNKQNKQKEEWQKKNMEDLCPYKEAGQMSRAPVYKPLCTSRIYYSKQFISIRRSGQASEDTLRNIVQ